MACLHAVCVVWKREIDNLVILQEIFNEQIWNQLILGSITRSFWRDNSDRLKIIYVENLHYISSIYERR